jgi:iron complex transport system substrate-binding protein
MVGYGTVSPLREGLPAVRCKYCNRLLFRGFAEMIEIKCPKCGAVHKIKNYETGNPNCHQKRFCRGDQPGLRRDEPGRVVTDSAGRVVVIPRRPQRVVALNASSLGLYCATGGEVVGRITTKMLAPEIRELIKDVPTVGEPLHPNTEKIIDIKPDLVLGMNTPIHYSLAKMLDKTGIPVLLQALTRYNDVLETLRFYGDLTGKPEQAAAKVKEIETRCRQLVRKNSGQPSPKVLAVWGTEEGLYTALSNSFVGDLVKRLGGVNISDTITALDAGLSYVPLRLETMVNSRPDVILLIAHGFEPSAVEQLRHKLSGSRMWGTIRAVQQNRVYALPYQLFSVNPGPRLGEALGVLTDVLYPRNVGNEKITCSLK